MDKLELFCTVGELDDAILEDAEEFLRAGPRKRRAPAWATRGSLAACAALALCAAWSLRPAGKPGQALQAGTPPSPGLAQSTANIDRPAVETGAEERNQSVVEMNWNLLNEAPPKDAAAMFALMGEDFVPMTREELLDYYGVSLPIQEIMPDLSATGPEEGGGFGRGIYRGAERGTYFDTNTFAFESAGGVYGVYITLDKVFHLRVSPWELSSNDLKFTDINGWQTALFMYSDEEGNQYFYTEFCQNGVDYVVVGKNFVEQAYAAVLKTLLEPREDFAPGETRAVTGTYTGGLARQVLASTEPDGKTATKVSYSGVLGLTLDDGSGLCIELTPEQAEEFYASLALGDGVRVHFIGEPATIGTVWTQQLVGIEAAPDQK